MLRGPLYEKDYRPQFSGHETFPLRYGWLKKSFDAIRDTETQAENKAVFTGEDAIARFGVGKNMVASMRHWATAAGIIKENINTSLICTTELGRALFDADGLDPFMEHPTTLWLIHWQLCGRPEKTTWFWAFNHFPSDMFERELLVRGLEKLAKDQGWSRVAPATIKRDVECFVRTYAARPSTHATHEDTLESPLTELGLIKPIGKRDGFRFVRGPKASLGQGVFLYALVDFWSRFSSASTLSFEAIAHEPGSPGRVFVLEENDVADRLVDLENASAGAFRWSETAGLKQVIRDSDLSPRIALDQIDRDYLASDIREVA